jgi:hypothetical protein
MSTNTKKSVLPKNIIIDPLTLSPIRCIDNSKIPINK